MILLIAGYSTQSYNDYNFNETVEGSSAVSDASLNNEGSNSLKLNLSNNVQQNQEYSTVMNIGPIPTIVYHDDWTNVTIHKVTVINQNSEEVESYVDDSLNGETIVMENVKSNGTYTYELTSEKGTSEFTVHIGKYKDSIVYGSYDDVI